MTPMERKQSFFALRGLITPRSMNEFFGAGKLAPAQSSSGV
jgi:hypothetical protein